MQAHGVELAFIAEARIISDVTSNQHADDRLPNLLEMILHLFDEVHLIFSSIGRVITVALWVLHCYLYDQFLHTPRLLIQSRKTGCGKGPKRQIAKSLYTSQRTPYWTVTDMVTTWDFPVVAPVAGTVTV